MISSSKDNKIKPYLTLSNKFNTTAEYLYLNFIIIKKEKKKVMSINRSILSHQFNNILHNPMAKKSPRKIPSFGFQFVHLSVLKAQRMTISLDN
jgi:hypothetical protein